MESVLVPFVVFASLALMVATPFYFRHRNRRIIYEAIRTSVEKTGAADPKLIDAITAERIGPRADLRRGVILISVAAACAIADVAFAAPDVGGLRLLALALFPGLVGAAYVGFHFFAPREATV